MAYVPCNGCTACCKGQRIIMIHDDDWAAYVTEPTRKGSDGAVERMLAHKSNGDCWYLEDGGCSIHDRVPRGCRDFDCRVWLSGFGIEDRAVLLKSPLDADCAKAALSLTGSSTT